MAYKQINMQIDFSKSETSLKEVFGNTPIPPTVMIKKLWDYIKKNNLQKKTK